MAVKFVRKMIAAGVPNGLFDNFTYEVPTSELEFALALGAMSRLHEESSGKSHFFTPIALGWHLPKEESAHHSLYHSDQFDVTRDIPGNAELNTQLQPALASTLASVVVVNNYGDRGISLVQEICRFRFKEGDREETTQYLMRNRIALGMAHMEIVAGAFLNNPLPLFCGGVSAGRSLFVLLHRRAFANMQDLKGADDLCWLEVRVVCNESRQGKRVIYIHHASLDFPIPEGSLMAVANIPWFKEPS